MIMKAPPFLLEQKGKQPADGEGAIPYCFRYQKTRRSVFRKNIRELKEELMVIGGNGSMPVSQAMEMLN